MNSLILTQSTDPYYNLALEELLLESHGGGALLYLWQNRHTVVIGRNQNAWKECRIAELEAGGGRLARRCSGGGAVYHDLGNLNFTFIAEKPAYDLPRQLGVITAALKRLGISASFTGRNDIVSHTGAKLSGNAFRHMSHASMHHGTILVSADMSALSRYLNPSPEKLRAKGVDSVRARVANLTDYLPGLTIGEVMEAVRTAYALEYGEYRILEEAALPAAALEEKRARYASWDWNKGAAPPFDIALERRFDWGGLELLLSLRGGVITACSVYTDAMDEALAPALSAALSGVKFSPGEMAGAVSGLHNAHAPDIARWLGEQ